jgi:hypothetical protein
MAFLYMGTMLEDHILQNIATRNPLLSGYLRFLPSDESPGSILAVHLDYCLA